jgi:hypothetical protein
MPISAGFPSALGRAECGAEAEVCNRKQGLSPLGKKKLDWNGITPFKIILCGQPHVRRINILTNRRSINRQKNRLGTQVLSKTKNVNLSA